MKSENSVNLILSCSLMWEAFVWLLRWKQVWEEGKELALCLPGPYVSHPELLGPFIPPPSPWHLKRCCLLLRPNSSVSKSAPPAPYTWSASHTSVVLYIKGEYLLHESSPFHSQRVKIISAKEHLMYVFCCIRQVRVGQTGRMRDLWWEMMDKIVNLGLYASFLMWRSGVLNA